MLLSLRSQAELRGNRLGALAFVCAIALGLATLGTAFAPGNGLATAVAKSKKKHHKKGTKKRGRHKHRAAVTGERGARGPRGERGREGAAGPRGIPGYDGSQGPQGPVGPQGPAGPQGPQGPAGPQGPMGPVGPTGATGPAGVRGEAGATGATGAQGPPGTDAQLPYTEYGMVSSLPSSPSVGDHCVFKASESVFWELIYDGQGSYPWKKIGGPPLAQYEFTPRSTTSTSFQTAGAPSVVTPLAGEYDVAAGAERISMPTGNNSIGRVGLHYNGGLVFEALGRGSNFSAYPAYAHRRMGGLGKGATLQSRYRAELEKAEFVTLFVQIDPIRVG